MKSCPNGYVCLAMIVRSLRSGSILVTRLGVKTPTSCK